MKKLFDAAVDFCFSIIYVLVAVIMFVVCVAIMIPFMIVLAPFAVIFDLCNGDGK